MSVRLITYDISSDKNRAKCRAAIEAYDYINIGGSDYLVNSGDSSSDIRDALAEFIDPSTDELFVCKVRKDQWAQKAIGKSKREWVEANAG